MLAIILPIIFITRCKFQQIQKLTWHFRRSLVFTNWYMEAEKYSELPGYWGCLWVWYESRKAWEFVVTYSLRKTQVFSMRD